MNASAGHPATVAALFGRPGDDRGRRHSK